MKNLDATVTGVHVPIWDILNPQKIYKDTQKFKIDPVCYESDE